MPPVVVSYGAGTNSTALLVRLVEMQAPVDLILFADTGGERPFTYDYVRTFSAWLVERGYPAITPVWYSNRAGERVTLEADCLRKGTLPSKAFGYSGCSMKWKAEPQEKFINNWTPARAAWSQGERVVKLLGFDADEPERAERRAHADAADKKYQYVYPLISWGWGREECVQAIDNAGLPRPGKSSCFFCPSMKKRELDLLLEEHPDLAVRAVALEDQARASEHGLDTVKGLGRRFAWKQYFADLLRTQIENTPMPEHADTTEETACGCYDG
jgi:hypothetical protein